MQTELLFLAPYRANCVHLCLCKFYDCSMIKVPKYISAVLWYDMGKVAAILCLVFESKYVGRASTAGIPFNRRRAGKAVFTLFDVAFSRAERDRSAKINRTMPPAGAPADSCVG